MTLCVVSILVAKAMTFITVNSKHINLNGTHFAHQKCSYDINYKHAKSALEMIILVKYMKPSLGK